MIYLCDIDGTIASLDHRLHFIKGTKKDWTRFFEACTDDVPIWPVIRLINIIHHLSEDKVVFITGRSDEIRSQTETWLISNVGFWTHDFRLLMRKQGDHREDYIVKSELLKNSGIDLKDIAGVFEDRQQVVDQYRAMGLTVFQVANGNF